MEAAPGLLWAHPPDLGPRLAALHQLHPDFDAVAAVSRSDHGWLFQRLVQVRFGAALWQNVDAAPSLHQLSRPLPPSGLVP